MIAKKQYDNVELSGKFNIGPAETDCITTSELVDIFCHKWGENQTWLASQKENTPHESCVLKLDCSKMRSMFNWRPMWNAETAIEKVVEWEKSAQRQKITDKQIIEYSKLISGF